MASPGVKRPLEDEAAPRTQTPEPSSNVPSSEIVTPNPIPGSPLSSVSSTALKVPDGLLQLSGLNTAGNAGTNSSSTPSAKRRKLTPAEKEAAKAEKERKAQEKAAQQAQKEAEKEAERQRKLEEKKQKDEEKEEKRRAKDHEKAVKDQERKEKQDKRDADKKAKEDEKRAQEEAKAKKERAQMRLTGFLLKKDGPSSPARSRASSVGSQGDSAETPQKQPLFLPFEAPTNGIIAPYNRFRRDEPAMKHATDALDTHLRADVRETTQTRYNKRSLADAFEPPVKRTRYSPLTPLKDIIARLRGTETQPIDLTASSSQNTEPPRQALRKVRFKLFYYKQDVRPAYTGTFTKTPNQCSLRQLSRKPFMAASSKVNYDYDSEAEWEEPEEGEDLDEPDGEEEEDEDGEDLEGFLDDEGAEATKRGQIMGDMEPIYTPLHFATGKRTATSDIVPFGDGVLDLKQYRIETLIEKPVWSIDPYSTEYWESDKQPAASSSAKSAQSSMAPPRVPLNPIAGATNIPLGQTTIGTQGSGLTKASAAPSKGRAGKPSAPVPIDLMDDFKAAILGSTLTKVGLVEVLKSKFPTLSKGTVQDTLEQIAERVGAKASEKHWILKAGA